MTTPREIVDLIERFTRNAESYRSRQYNETQVRREFIDPFFKCLGWDIDNRLGFAEAYKDVIHEDAIKVGGVTKAPDYCFRIGGTRKFFLEAKRPSVNLKNDPEPAFQLRRYAWSAKLPLSILTDFEEFAVYDCRVKPDQTDKAAAARIRYLTFTDYAEQWNSIADTFSKDAVLKGAFDKYADASKFKKGTATVDAAFLKEIEGWRELLAKNIARRNPALTQRELNYAVQVTIDRILFLRMCEDRGIEPYGQLGNLQHGTAVYERIRRVYRKADERYNSGLFHFTTEDNRSESPDELTPNLSVDDKPLKDILKSLYYPESPYEFSVLPAEILGHVYEQFLGKVIRLTSGHRAVVEEKPEIRKAGGVYYTPTYVVEYIVKNTVGKLLEGKTPRQAANLKVLDPACGSGSFLLGAYQYLLDWHRDRYLDGGSTKPSKQLFQGRGGAWHLTIAEKKRILLNNIYGVDVDPQAVEVTKLSLLLKVLEGESLQTLDRQLLLFHERALPDLGRNIKCGNSLIGPDFYEGQQLLNVDEAERYRINVFDWTGAFPQIMKAGGFTAVIGNPPYVDVKLLGSDLKRVLAARYVSATRRFDLSSLFIEKGLTVLREGGLLGFIVPSMFMRREYGQDLRYVITQLSAVEHVVDFGSNQVFRGPMNYVSIIVLRRSQPQGDASVLQFEHGLPEAALRQGLAGSQTRGLKEFLSPAQVFENASEWFFSTAVEANLKNRLFDAFPPLNRLLDYASEGIHSGKDEVFFLPRKKAEELELESPPTHPLAKGKDVHRYAYVNVSGLAHTVIYAYDLSSGAPWDERTIQKESPRIWNYLVESKSLLGGRRYFEKSSKLWYELWCPRNPLLYTTPKIIGPEIACRGEFTICRESLFVNNKIKVIIPTKDTPETLEYLLGILNSSLLVYLHRSIAPPKGGGFFEVKTGILGRLPVRRIEFNDPKDESQHNQIVMLVQQMLGLYKQLLSEMTPHGKTVLSNHIVATNRQIDKLVYALYGLSPEEIRIVEHARIDATTSSDPDEQAAPRPYGEDGLQTGGKIVSNLLPLENGSKADGLVSRFRRLAKTWKDDTAHLSSTARMAKHPAYQEIIKMGAAALPLLLGELSQGPEFWFVALRTITGENPVPESAAGKIDEITHAWLGWGRERGLIK